MDACPMESTKRSRLLKAGFLGLYFMASFQST